MTDKLVGVLLEGLIRLVADRLIAFFRLQYVVEVVSTFFTLAFLIVGAVAYWAGWL